MTQTGTNQKESFQLLEDNKVEIVKSLSELEKLFDWSSLHTNEPLIHSNYDCLIFFDTPTYNSSYLTDLINEYLTTYDKLTFAVISNMLKLNNDNISKELDIVNDLKGKVITQTKKTKFYYCQDDNIYSILFENYINKRLKSDKQVPVILTLKANVHNKPKDIFIDIETIAPLNYNTIMKNMVLLYDYNLNF